MKKTAIGIIVIGLLTMGVFAFVRGRISGTILDPAGAPVGKVTVKIVSQSMASIRFEVKSDAAGKFSQVGLQPGYYMLTFTKEGFKPASREVHVEIDTPTIIEVKLETSAAEAAATYSEADLLFLKGNKLFEEKDYAGAAAAFEAALQKSADQWGYYLNLGLAHKKLNAPDKAGAAFAAAVKLNPESYSANREYGESLAKAQDFQAALPYYQKAAALSPTDPDAFFNLGICLSQVEGPDAALAAYRKCVEIKPDYADAYYEIGTICLGQNKKEEAAAALTRFLELAPQHGKAEMAKKFLEFLKR